MYIYMGDMGKGRALHTRIHLINWFTIPDAGCPDAGYMGEPIYSELYYAMICHDTLCYAMICYDTLCYTMIYYDTLCYDMI